MADLHPDDLKDQGNTALKEGRVSEAVSLYTKAIALDSRNAVYFGNRAAAYLQLDKASEALADADRSIDAQRTYIKGYAHKGTALEKMGRFEEAKAAYRAGLEVEEGNAMLTRKLKELQDRTSPRPAPAASASSAAGAGAPASGSSGTARADSPIIKFGRVGMLVLAIAYLLPYIGLGARAYTGAMLLSIIVHGALVMQEAGPFRFSAEFAAGALQSYWALPIMTAAVSFATHPSIFLLVGATLLDLVAAGETVRQLAAPRAPALSAAIARAADAALPALLGRSGEEVSRMSAATKWSVARGALERLSALAEVLGAVAMLVEAVLVRSLAAGMGAFLFWQTHGMKYTLSAPHREAWGSLDTQIRGLTANAACPRPVASGYDWLAAKLRSRVKSPEDMMAEARARQAGGGAAGGAAGGAGAGCVVQ